MSERDFWQSEYWIISNQISAFEEKENREWQKFSWLAAYVISPYTKKGQKAEPQKLAPWAWDVVEKVTVLSAEERQKRFSKLDKYMKRKHGKE